MINRKVWFGMVLLGMAMSAACSTADSTPDTDPAADMTVESVDPGHVEEMEDPNTALDMGEVGILILEAIMQQSRGLEKDMEFIAIDTSRLTGLDESDKAQILAHFRSSGTDVMEATFRQLKDMGLYDEKTMVLKGVLLTIEEAVISDNRIEASGSKYRSAKGAVGVNVVVERVDGKWQVAKAEETWIS